MSRFEQIKQMSLEEIAQRAIQNCETMWTKCVVSLLDMTAHNSIEEAIEYNKKWLENESV